MQFEKQEQDFAALSHRILDISNKGIPRIDFFRELSAEIHTFTGCDTIEMLLSEEEDFIHTRVNLNTPHSFQYESVASTVTSNGERIPISEAEPDKYTLHTRLVLNELAGLETCTTAGGSIFCNSPEDVSDELRDAVLSMGNSFIILDQNEFTLSVLPVVFGNSILGTILFYSKKKIVFDEKQLKLMEEVAGNVGISVINQRTQSALQERVKELTCLYRITQVAEPERKTLRGILQSVVDTLPPAWQYPEITNARISYEGQVYLSKNYRPGWQKQVADIVVRGKKKGHIEVAYTESRPYLDEGPFLREERNLIEAIARQLSLIIERKEAQKERLELQEQLRHADRLAIIGQLAAGVAHELNEPLGSILGFAQLAKKTPDFPEQADKDIDKIIKASLYAREIIRKLLVFAREITTQVGMIDMNQVVGEGLFFLEARCQKQGIEIIRSLDSGLPMIEADGSQMHQLLVNLVVNSIQAMPDGGTLTIRTYRSKDHVFLVVRDTGIGMTEKTKSQIFIPFFTTKDVNEGTGLGLAVVHGIVSSHKGRIKVESEPGQGARFEVRFPVASK